MVLLLVSFSDNVRNDNAMGSLFINSIAEDISKPILSRLFNCYDLQNLNYITGRNYPAIDLGDKKRRISFQITSDSSLDKVRDTLEMFVQHKLYNDYDELYFYFIKDNKESSYKSQKIKQILSGTNFNFDVNQHILDNSDISKFIRERLIDYPDKIRDIYELLNKHYGDITSKIVPVNIETTIINLAPPSIKNVILSKNGKLQYFQGFENNDAESLYLSGNKSIHEKNYENAFENFDKAIDALNKNMAQVLNDKGVCYCYQEDISSGIDEFEKAVSLYANNSKLRHNLGYSYFRINDYLKAITELEISLKLKNDDSTKEILLESYYKQAQIFIEKRAYTKSLRLFQKMNQIEPENISTLTNIAVSNVYLENYQKAIEIFEDLVSKNPEDFLTYFNLGSTYSKNGEYENAISYFEKALEIEPKHQFTYYNMGINFIKMEKYDLAIKAYQNEIALFPEYARTYKDLAIAFDLNDQYDKAKENYLKAIELDPTDPNLQSCLGEFYLNRKEYDLAIKRFTIVKELSTNDASNYNDLGLAFLNMGNFEEAENCFVKACNINSMEYKALNNLGVLYEQTNQLNKSELFLKKALEIKLDNLPSYITLREIYIKKEDYDNLLSVLFKLLEFEPNKNGINFDIGFTYYHKNDFDNAEKYYLKELELASPNISVFYELSCIYSLKNLSDLALEYLKKAISIDSKYIEMAKSNPDFENIKNNPKFIELLEPNNAGK